MSEQKKNSSRNKQEQSFSQDPVHVRRRRAAGATMATLLLGAGYIGHNLLSSGEDTHPKEISRETLAKFEPYRAPLESLSIVNGARIREEPSVVEGDFTNQLTSIDIADLPDDYAFTITLDKDTPTFIAPDKKDRHNQAAWVGIPAELIADSFPSTKNDILQDKDGVVWVNGQKASYSKADQ